MLLIFYLKRETPKYKMIIGRLRAFICFAQKIKVTVERHWKRGLPKNKA